MAPPLTIAEIAVELENMLQASLHSPAITQRLLGRRLRVLYEFLPAPGDASAAGQDIVPYLLVLSPEGSRVEQTASPYDTVDVVVRTAPGTLQRLTNGSLGGREAMASGMLDIRKAPSMPKLLQLRALFNAHKKAQQRAGQAAAAVAGSEGAA